MLESDSERDGAFFGRCTISALFEKRLEAFQNGYRQNISIVGCPFLGKTAIVKHFFTLSARTNLIPIFLSCQSFDLLDRLAQRWLSEFLIRTYHAIHRSAPANFQTLVRSLRSVIPKTLRCMKNVKKLILKRRLDPAFRELLGLTSSIHAETGKNILVILDDFDRLAEMDLTGPFASLGQEIMVQKYTMYVVTSGNRRRSESILHDQLALLFGNFEMIDLKPFDFDESKAFLKERFPNRILESELVRFLIRLTNGCPYYLDLLARRFSQFSGNDNVISNQKLIVQALTEELYEPSGLLNLRFFGRLYQLADGKAWPYYADVLAAIASGYKKFFDMARFLHQPANEN